MILKDIEIHGFTPYSRETEITLESNHLCELFLTLLKKYSTPSTAKVVITLVEPEIIQQNGFLIKRDFASVLLDIIEYNKDFVYSEYYNLSASQKKKIIWKLIYDSMVNIGKQLNWDITLLEIAYKRGIELNYKNITTVFEGKKSPTNYDNYKIIADFEINEVTLYLIFYDKSGKECHRIEIAKRDTSWGYYNLPELKKGKLNWNGNILELYYKKSISVFNPNENIPDVTFEVNV